jgi:protein gp37
MVMWSPWRGCHRYSEGCRYCYIHKGDIKRGIDTNDIVRTDNFDQPTQRKKNGDYKIKPGSTVYVCFSADFLIEEADGWRDECWRMIRERKDLKFIFLTKRIVRFTKCIPDDWNDGYDNVTVGCTIEDQETADERLSVFDKLPIKHKNIIAQPLIGKIDIEKHLNGVELVIAGGEQDKDARPLLYDWVLDVKEQCSRHDIEFQFRQTGTNLIIDGKRSRKSVKELEKEIHERSEDKKIFEGR